MKQKLRFGQKTKDFFDTKYRHIALEYTCEI